MQGNDQSNINIRLIMHADYTWKQGVPTGIPGTDKRFEIITDPYGKRYVVLDVPFSKLIYDSSILDFRHLNPRNQLGWLREPLDEAAHLIRDRDHFPKLIEKQTFKNDLAVQCTFYSLQGFIIGEQRIYYTHLGDSFNGVILFDSLGKPVLKKEYSVNSDQEFTELQQEIFSF